MVDDLKQAFASFIEKVKKKAFKIKKKDLNSFDISLTDKDVWICTFCDTKTPHEHL